MNSIFLYDNVVVGLLVLIVGFGFHWIGQTISLINWDLAQRLGLQETDAPAAYRVYEHGIAVADVSIGWLYGVVGVGLLLGTPWAYTLAWLPGVVLVYHAIGFWAWTANQRRDGHVLYQAPIRAGWIAANLATGLLAILLAWNSS